MPLNDVGPPAVPLGLPLCAMAKVANAAKAAANAIVLSFKCASYAEWTLLSLIPHCRAGLCSFGQF